MKKKLLLILSILLIGYQSNAQLNAWSKRVQINVVEGQGTAMTNFPVRIVFNTQIPIAAGNMDVNGHDIRFSSDSCGNNLLHYWIESNMNSSSTIIFVNIDFAAANSPTPIYMFYGNPAISSVSSNIDSVFSSYWISGGHDTTLSGSVSFDYFKLETGDTLNLVDSNALELLSTYTIIDGFVNGRGKGYPTSKIANTYANGFGPGAGNFENGEASSGGGYGGAGGDGGADSPPFAIGGIAYGTTNLDTIQMGSSGGSTNDTCGANGGGAMSIRGIMAVLSGNIILDGDSVISGSVSIGRCGGSGAGGGFLVYEDHIDFSGIISVKGGNGSVGSNPSNDGGGGGGGGRIKVFYNGNYSNTGTMVKDGGLGGVGSSTAPGSPGQAGTLYAAPTGNPVKYGIDIIAEVNNPGCNSVTIENNILENTWKLYPNPSNGKITIETISINNVSFVEIIDANGRLLLSDILNTNSKVYDLSIYNKGLYFVRIYNSNKVELIKLVIE